MKQRRGDFVVERLELQDERGRVFDEVPEALLPDREDLALAAADVLVASGKAKAISIFAVGHRADCDRDASGCGCRKRLKRLVTLADVQARRRRRLGLESLFPGGPPTRSRPSDLAERAEA